MSRFWASNLGRWVEYEPMSNETKEPESVVEEWLSRRPPPMPFFWRITLRRSGRWMLGGVTSYKEVQENRFVYRTQLRWDRLPQRRIENSAGEVLIPDFTRMMYRPMTLVDGIRLLWFYLRSRRVKT